MRLFRPTAAIIAAILSLGCAHHEGQQTKTKGQPTTTAASVPADDDLKVRSEAVLKSLNELSASVEKKIKDQDIEGKIENVREELKKISHEIDKSAQSAEKNTRQSLSKLLEDMEHVIDDMQASLNSK